MVKHHVNMDMCGIISSSACTKDSKAFYGGTNYGRLYKLSPYKREVIGYFGYICKGIDSMVITPDQKFLLMGCVLGGGEEQGKLLQWSLTSDNLVKDYGMLFENSIQALTVTPDSKTVFLGSNDGEMKEISLLEKKVVKDYKDFHYCTMDMKITEDGKYLITASEDQSMKVLSIEKRRLIKNCEFIHPEDDDYENLITTLLFID